PTERVDPAWLIALVAECLEVPEDEIDPGVPLVRYGLDSVAAVQVATAIADKLGRDVPDDLLLGHPDVGSLARYMEAVPGPRVGGDAASALEQMRADGVLPDDVRPDRIEPAPAAPRAVLLTGATGFLGAYLLRTLLRETTARVYCLVRPGRQDAGERVRRNLQALGIWAPAFAPRVHAVAGDLLRPGLGLAADLFERLAPGGDGGYPLA